MQPARVTVDLHGLRCPLHAPRERLLAAIVAVWMLPLSGLPLYLLHEVGKPLHRDAWIAGGVMLAVSAFCGWRALTRRYLELEGPVLRLTVSRLSTLRETFSLVDLHEVSPWRDPEGGWGLRLRFERRGQAQERRLRLPDMPLDEVVWLKTEIAAAAARAGAAHTGAEDWRARAALEALTSGRVRRGDR